MHESSFRAVEAHRTQCVTNQGRHHIDQLLDVISIQRLVDEFSHPRRVATTNLTAFCLTQETMSKHSLAHFFSKSVCRSPLNGNQYCSLAAQANHAAKINTTPCDHSLTFGASALAAAGQADTLRQRYQAVLDAHGPGYRPAALIRTQQRLRQLISLGLIRRHLRRSHLRIPACRGIPPHPADSQHHCHAPKAHARRE